MTHIHLLLLVVMAAPTAQDTVRRPPQGAPLIAKQAPFHYRSDPGIVGSWDRGITGSWDHGIQALKVEGPVMGLYSPKIMPPQGLQEHWVQDAKLYGLHGSGDFGLAPFHQQWYQGDPADSLYRAAYGLFTRTEYRPAADRFALVRSRHPTTSYWCDASYYEAYARYRLGTSNDLRSAHSALESMGTRCTRANANQDVPQLRIRVDAALARQGDSAAAERVRRSASEGQNVCDSEERGVKANALSVLAQMDAEAAAPVIRTILATKDACSAPLRREAISIVSRRNDAGAVTMLVQIARNDADRELQLAAVGALSAMTNDAAFAAMEDLLRTSNDERVQTSIASSMARNDQPRAQNAVRAMIERRDVSERIRESAINSLSGRNLTVEYWRGVYGKMESDALRRAVINAVSRINTDEAQQFLLSVARDPAQPLSSREAALSRIRGSAPISELYKIMETADSRGMRLNIVSGLSARKEPEATDRLIDIAGTSTDPEVRTAAIRALSIPPRKTEPKVIKALGDIIVRGSGE